MKTLWAPWRINYILQEKPEGCLFCKKPKEQDDERNYILVRTDRTFMIMNLYPYNNGHLMVAPYRHISDLEALDEQELFEMVGLVKEAVRVLKEILKPQGFNIGLNLGKCAGAGVEDHLHVHIVPRWTGDTSFMPVLSEAKVIPEALGDTYKTLLNGLKNT